MGPAQSPWAVEPKEFWATIVLRSVSTPGTPGEPSATATPPPSLPAMVELETAHRPSGDTARPPPPAPKPTTALRAIVVLTISTIASPGGRGSDVDREEMSPAP